MAAYGEKSADHLAQRNGYRDRNWQTQPSNVELQVPKQRTGSCFCRRLSRIVRSRRRISP
ncbi:hypothetical protein DYI37_19430 [Fulvimarina endophytica]|uniref:Uncharacterized protein n=1 Tax=Fulvimarina endophytica TaxID=2293836 RepID=A0A371WXZ6_9HYPH|nr:hypothetical protein DYI37_19430 [Fulvimarina endophytica]